MALAIVQFGSADGPGTDPTITLGAAPTPGNWIVACYMANGAISNPNTSGWTAITASVAFNSDRLALYYRKVVGGDSATLPVFESPAQTAHAAAVAYEISGADSTWANVLDQAHIDGSTSLTNTFTSGSYTTAVDNELVLSMYGTNGFSQPAPTATSPFNQDVSTSATFHSRGSGHNSYPTAGTSVSMSNGSWSTGGSSRNAALVFLKPLAIINVNLTGASAAGAAHALTVDFDSNVSLTGAASAAAAGSVGPQYDGHASPSGASAAGSAGVLGHSVSFGMVGVSSASSGGIVDPRTEPFAVFPVFSIMRNTPVATVGAMSDDPVCVIGQLLPAGPEPISTAVHLVGASAAAAFSQPTPTRNLTHALAGVFATGSPGFLVGTDHPIVNQSGVGASAGSAAGTVTVSIT